MAFLQAMDSHITKIVGENGSAELSSTSDPRVDLFFALVRNLTKDRASSLVKEFFTTTVAAKQELLVDLFVMAFQTRDCRGGKGEKDLFSILFFELAKRYPETAKSLLPLIPEYGCFKDWFSLAEEAYKEAQFQFVGDACIDLAAAKLLEDLQILQAAQAAGRRPEKISLLAKWTPREGHHFESLAKKLSVKMFPGEPKARAQYRKALSALNRHLSTVETLMCGNRWEEIQPGKVPSVCLMKVRKALMNEKCKEKPTPAQAETGNRHPEDEARVGLRKRVREALLEEGSKKLKGKQLYPHEISKKLMGRGGASDLEAEVFNAMWKDIRASTKEALEAFRAEQAAKAIQAVEGVDALAAAMSKSARITPKGAIDLGKLVPLVDVSGSMSGIPMEVAIALGILVSELTAPEFANRLITFESNPQWVKLEEGSSIAEKVQVTMRAPWGGSTDFAKAIELILGVAQAAKLTPDQIPDMIVFSDMQFDEAGRFDETHHERLVRRFAETGTAVCGQPWPVPGIIYWNLRANTVGFPAAANTPGVRLLSGFSPSLLKLLLAGEPLEGEEEAAEPAAAAEGGAPVTTKPKVNPLTTIRAALDAKRYDAVRVALAASKEGLLADYSFVPEAEPPAAMKDEAEAAPTGAAAAAAELPAAAAAAAAAPPAPSADDEEWEAIPKEE